MQHVQQLASEAQDHATAQSQLVTAAHQLSHTATAHAQAKVRGV